MNKENVFQNVREYLQKLHPNEKINITSTDNLFDLGYLTSVSTFGLIESIENLLGQELPIENYSPSAFHSLESIFEAFFASTAEKV